MKKGIIIGYTLGFLTCVGLLLIEPDFRDRTKGKIFFDEPRPYHKVEAFHVNKVVNKNHAFALIYKLDRSFGCFGPDMNFQELVLLKSNKNHIYYDGQVIYHKDMKVRQIGIYKYKQVVYNGIKARKSIPILEIYYE